MISRPRRLFPLSGRNSLIFLGIASLITLHLGCASGTPEITIDELDAKISPVIVGSGSVFMKIHNTGRGDDTLRGATVNIPGSIVELHDVNEGKMVIAEGIPIPARSIVQLRPASYHIMIFTMPKETREGSDFIITLIFEKSGKMSVPVQFTSSHPLRKR